MSFSHELGLIKVSFFFTPKIGHLFFIMFRIIINFLETKNTCRFTLVSVFISISIQLLGNSKLAIR